MRYKEELAKRVLDKTDIVKLIGSVTKLQKGEETYLGNCPFHKDDNYSLVVYPNEQSYHCFDCGQGGNAIDFIMDYKHAPMDKAIEFLAQKAGIEITKDDIETNSSELLKQKMYSIYKDAAIFYENRLKMKDGQSAMAYLKGRSYDDKTIHRFGLGYSPTKGNTLYKYLLKKGYSQELMVQSGLVKVSETGPYDMFRGRVMFPIVDSKNNIVAFSGRVMDAEIKPKYLNSPESPIFNKSATFYGINDVQKKRHPFMILCEGQPDVISQHQNGFSNSVATLGTAFTQAHIPIMKRYTDTVVLMYDNDGAGKKAAMRAINTLRGSDMKVRVASLAPCKDPDEFIKTFGPQEYKNRIARSVDQKDFQLQYLATQFDLNDPKQKDEYLQSAVKLIMDSQERTQEPKEFERN